MAVNEIKCGLISKLGEINSDGTFLIIVKGDEFLVPPRPEFSKSEKEMAQLYYCHQISVIIRSYQRSDEKIARYGFSINKNDHDSLTKWKELIVKLRNYAYLDKLLSFLNLIQDRQSHKIDSKDFNKYIAKLYSERNSFSNTSADSYGLVPDRILELVQVVKDNMYLPYSERNFIDSLGIMLVRDKATDLLKILGKYDKKAKKKKKRHKLPKELIGKNLVYEKVSDIEWKVKILPRNDLCFYEKQYALRNETDIE